MNSRLIILSNIYIICLVLANIASAKMTDFFGITLDAGFIFFPVTYIISDIITEVYGFNVCRKIIWSGLLINIFVAVSIYIVIKMPPSIYFEKQKYFEEIFASSFRVFFASSLAYIFGEMTNSWIMHRLKQKFSGNLLAIRCIASTAIGAFLESLLFFYVAFLFIIPASVIFKMFIVQYIMKICYEIILLPFIIKIIDNIKYSDVAEGL